MYSSDRRGDRTVKWSMMRVTNDLCCVVSSSYSHIVSNQTRYLTIDTGQKQLQSIWCGSGSYRSLGGVVGLHHGSDYNSGAREEEEEGSIYIGEGLTGIKQGLKTGCVFARSNSIYTLYSSSGVGYS